MPRSPLPRRDGLDARWVRTPDRVAGQPAPWPTMHAFLRARLPDHVDIDAIFARSEFVDERGVPLAAEAPYRPHTLIWFPGPAPTDDPPTRPLQVLYRDDRIVVIDKPHFQATTPQGSHARNTALVQVRTELGLAEASPAHRLDRLTAGVLVFTIDRRWRRPYQELFAGRATAKVYEALTQHRTDLEFPRTVRSHIVKDASSLQARQLPDAEPNAETRIELVEVRADVAHCRLTPITGRTHQLRVHLNSLGMPLLHDPLYPVVLDDDAQPEAPLQLIARSLAFTDPVSGRAQQFTSTRELQWPTSPAVPH